MRALAKRRTFPLFEEIRNKTAFFGPTDWLVVSVLSVIMGLSALTLLAGVSLALTEEVPTHGGSYTEGVIGSPRFVNPLLALSETDRDLTALVFSGLLKTNPDGSLAPDVAESYTMSEDKLTYTFIIKEDARFHDGTPVTADDVVFTIRGAQNPDVKSPRRADWEGVQVSAADLRTVTFTLNAPYAPFPELTTMGILPKHLWEKVSAEEFPFTTLNARPIGTGPYKVETVRENSSGIPVEYRLRANTDGVRVPYIDRFNVKFYSDEEEVKSALNRSEIDGASSINPKTVLSAHTLHEAVFGRIFAVFFNQSQNNLFADISVRRALDAALDKKTIISTVVSGYGSEIDGPLPPESIGQRNNALDVSGETRLENARAILTKAGWKLGEDGVFQKTVTVKGKKTSTRLAFSLSTSNAPELKQTAELTGEAWRAFGAEVTLKFFEQNDLNVEVIRPRKYDALLFGEVVGREPDLFAFWHSSQRNDPGLNIALYANTDVDKQLEKARTDSDPDVRKTASKAAAEMIGKEVAAIFLYAPHFVYLAPPSVSGISFGTISVPADRFDAVSNWYLSTERVWPIFMFDAKNLFK